MTRAIVIGNWKMNLDYVEAIHLVQQLGVLLRASAPINTDVVVAPPFVDLRSVTSVIEADRLPIDVGAQHVHFNESGAFTGEVSMPMLKRLGIKYVVVGHSERRTGFGMTDEIVRATLDAVLAGGMTVVLCCGEDLATREAGHASEFVAHQIGAALEGVNPKFSEQIIVAYEPIWAIGSGKAANTEIVHDMINVVRNAIPSEVRAESRILYGGSVTADNATEILGDSGADGFLVGGASLRAEDFVGIVTAVDACYRT